MIQAQLLISEIRSRTWPPSFDHNFALSLRYASLCKHCVTFFNTCLLRPYEIKKWLELYTIAGHYEDFLPAKELISHSILNHIWMTGWSGCCWMQDGWNPESSSSSPKIYIRLQNRTSKIKIFRKLKTTFWVPTILHKTSCCFLFPSFMFISLCFAFISQHSSIGVFYWCFKNNESRRFQPSHLCKSDHVVQWYQQFEYEEQ